MPPRDDGRQDLTPEALARACAEAMWADDLASRALDMTLHRIGVGLAVVSMPITDQMLNGHGSCHGGYIFTLADSAFSFACNTYNRVTVAQHCQITFVAPGAGGDRLTATAREVERGGRNGIYDVTVANQDGKRIAEFRGNSREIAGRSIL